MRNRYLLIIAICAVACIFSACREMESSYREYVVSGGITYPGKAKNLVAYSGFHRVKLSWNRGNDPSITHARVFWNYFTDSLELAIPANADTISCIIDNLEENNYSFIVKQYNKNGGISIPSEALGIVYGDNYVSGLRNRIISSVTINHLGVLNINWGEADVTNGTIGMKVQYTDTLNNERTDFFGVSHNPSVIKPLASFRYRTLFVPDSMCIDTFYTDYQENTTDVQIMKSNWSVVDFSSQHNTSASNRVTNIIDDNLATRWHTHLTSSSYPHHVTIDMGSVYKITAMSVARPNGNVNGCDSFRIMLSLDNVTWTDAGTFDFDRLKDGAVIYKIEGSPSARYFRFVGVTGPFNYMVMGELGAYGTK